MVRRVSGQSGRVFGTRLLIALVGVALLGPGLTACGATQPRLGIETAARATELFPTASPTPYATAPGGNVSPPAGSVAAASQAAGSAVVGSAVIGTTTAVAGTPAAAAMASPTPTVRR